MPEQTKVLGVVPARGGSKGIPMKNLLEVAGRTLLDWTLELALDIPEVTSVCVSTDHFRIKRAAEAHSRVTVIDRPENLAGDRVGDVPVLQHALVEMERATESSFDVVVMLQVTSPLRTTVDVLSCLETLSTAQCDAVWTVSPTELHYHPMKQLAVDNKARLTFIDSRGIDIVARQELEQTFHRNGCCYALRRDFLATASSLYSPNRTKAVLSRGPRVNIDGPGDVELAEKFLSLRSD